MALFHSLLWLSNIPFIYVPISSHSAVRGHLGCFHVLTIVYSAAMNTGLHVSFWIRVFSRCVSRNGTAGSYSSSIFSFLWNIYTISHSSCTNLQSHQQLRKIPFSPHPLHCWLFVDFLMRATVTWLRFYLTVVLICDSLIINCVLVLSHSVVSSSFETPRTVQLFWDPTRLLCPWNSQSRLLWVVISSSGGSSWPRDPTPISCIGRQVLYHWHHPERVS